MSPYFPTQADTPPYFCPNCKSWYQAWPGNVSCCVAHAPGTCCHEYESPAASPNG